MQVCKLDFCHMYIWNILSVTKIFYSGLKLFVRQCIFWDLSPSWFIIIIFLRYYTSAARFIFVLVEKKKDIMLPHIFHNVYQPYDRNYYCFLRFIDTNMRIRLDGFWLTAIHSVFWVSFSNRKKMNFIHQRCNFFVVERTFTQRWFFMDCDFNLSYLGSQTLCSVN